MNIPPNSEHRLRPIVSVMMTTYNHEAYISQAVESILAQEFDFPYEIVVGEDCSTDHTRDILEGFASQHPGVIRLLSRETNWGRRKNYIDTFKSCSGKYVAILEGDDYWTSPSKLQRQVDFLEQHPDYTICFHPAIKFFEVENREVLFQPPDLKPTYSLPDLLDRNFIATCTVMFCNNLFDDFPDWFHHVPAGDWPLHILNAEHGLIGFLPETMAVHRIHPGGVWSPKKNSLRLRSQIQILHVIRDHLGLEYRERASETLARLQLLLLLVHWRERNIRALWGQLNWMRANFLSSRSYLVKAFFRLIRSN